MARWIHTDAVKYITCSHCSAEPGIPCRMPSGRKARVPHTERTQAVIKKFGLERYQSEPILVVDFTADPEPLPTKFKIGDLVTLTTDRNRITDFQSDLILDLQDGTINNNKYCKTVMLLNDPKTGYKVFRVREDGYELIHGRFQMPFVFRENDLRFPGTEPVPVHRVSDSICVHIWTKHPTLDYDYCQKCNVAKPDDWQAVSHPWPEGGIKLDVGELRAFHGKQRIIPEEVMYDFRNGFQEEHYLVAAIKTYLLTDHTKALLHYQDISIEDILNGRVGGEPKATIVREALSEWNTLLGEKVFFPEIY